MTAVTLDSLITLLHAFIWPFLRFGAMLMAAPVFGASTVSVRIRVALAVALSVLTAPLLPPLPELNVLSAAGILIAIQQIVIGVAMGFFLHLVLTAVVLVGSILGMSMGLGFAMAIDPQNGTQVPVLSQFFMICATLLLLAVNGHVLLIGLLVDSFTAYPIGGNLFTSDALYNIALWAGRAFGAALIMSLPVMMAILLVNLCLGVITRTAPQLNIFAIGFPITIFVGLVLMIFAMPVLQMQIVDLFDEALSLLAIIGQTRVL